MDFLDTTLDCDVHPTPVRTLAVLASGQGTNFEALARASERGELGGRIALLVSDRPDAPALDRARRHGIEALHLPAGRFRTRLEDETPWIEALRSKGVEVVLLAGFMRRLHEPFIRAFPRGILNLHPSLLPSFPGLSAIGQAFAHGVAITGCTVHLVDAGLDSGPIVAQAPVEVRDGDTLEDLEARMHEAEHALYPRAVRRYLTEPWRIEDRRLVFGPLEEARGG
jgi:phosphoribosylglycinamide formyltransferase-1